MAFVKYSRPNPMHLYEMNFYALMQLVPELSDELQSNVIAIRDNESIAPPFVTPPNKYFNFEMDKAYLSICLLEVNRYTQHIQVTNQFKSDEKLLPTLSLNIRVYHDVSLAEVVSCSGAGKLLPDYDYPNEKMLLKDEKRQANRLLFEWLSSAKTFYRFEPETQKSC